MTDNERLKRVIDRQGISISELSRRSGASRKRVYAILDGADATAQEIVGLSGALLMDDTERDQIFLAKNVTNSDK